MTETESTGLQSHWLMLAMFLGLMAGVIVLLPVVKLATDAAARRPSLQHALKFKPGPAGQPGTYSMGRVARRMMMLAALALFVACRKRLNISGLAATGLKRGPGWSGELAWGAGIGIGSLALFSALLMLLGAWVPAAGSKPLLTALGKSLATAAAVGFLEEVLFRGFLLQSLRGSLGVRWALVLSSGFYSILHFFRATVRVPVGFDPWVGLKTVGAFFAPIVREPAILAAPDSWNESIVPGTVGLFLVGIVLGYAFIRTNRLYLSIGLHAGWVFMLKFQRAFIDRAGHELNWLYGDKNVVTGLLGWFFLLALWAVLTRWPARRQEPE